MAAGRSHKARMSHTAEDQEQEYPSSRKSLRKGVAFVQLHTTSCCRQGREDEGIVKHEATADILTERSIEEKGLVSTHNSRWQLITAGEPQEGTGSSQSHPSKAERSDHACSFACFLLSHTVQDSLHRELCHPQWTVFSHIHWQSSQSQAALPIGQPDLDNSSAKNLFPGDSMLCQVDNEKWTITQLCALLPLVQESEIV